MQVSVKVRWRLIGNIRSILRSRDARSWLGAYPPMAIGSRGTAGRRRAMKASQTWATDLFFAMAYVSDQGREEQRDKRTEHTNACNLW